MTNETAPGLQVQSDQDWEDWLRGQISTEFHPSSTCAMLPREQGGVVDANLRVYGLSNVRVADASVPPFVFSAHLMSSTYGLAEQASVMIRAFHNTAPLTGSGTVSGVGSGASSSPIPAAATTTPTSLASPSGGPNHTARDVGLGVGIPLGVVSLALIFWFGRRLIRQTPSNKDYGVVRVVPSTEAFDQHELDDSRENGSLFKYEAVPTQGAGEEGQLVKKEVTVGVLEIPAAG